MLNQMVRVFFGTTCLRASGSIENPVVCFRFTGSCPASPFIYSMLDCGIWGEEHLWAIETKGGQGLITSATDIRLLFCWSPLFTTRSALRAVAIIINFDSYQWQINRKLLMYWVWRKRQGFVYSWIQHYICKRHHSANIKGARAHTLDGNEACTFPN